MNKDERFTDVWCSETGHIGITDKGIDKVMLIVMVENLCS